jgi:hypothetical protein
MWVMYTKILLVLFMTFFLYGRLQGQGMIANLNLGYTATCSFESYHDTSSYYSASIQNSRKYGIDLGNKIDKFFSADLSLQYQSTLLPANIHYNGIDHSQDYHVAMIWMLVGGTTYLPAGNFDLFFGTHAGVCIYHFYDSVDKSSSRFAWSVRGGFGYLITKRIGINFRGDALFSMDPLKEKFSTPGLSNGKTGFSYFFQFGCLAGITISLSK